MLTDIWIQVSSSGLQDNHYSCCRQRFSKVRGMSSCHVCASCCHCPRVRHFSQSHERVCSCSMHPFDAIMHQKQIYTQPHGDWSFTCPVAIFVWTKCVYCPRMCFSLFNSTRMALNAIIFATCGSECYNLCNVWL